MATFELDDLFSAWDGSDRPGGVVAVVRDGAIVHTKAYGMADLERSVPLTGDSVFDIASISKQFVACCTLLLANEGRLDLDADIRTWLPELPTYATPVTPRHLLHHTGGLPEYLDVMALRGQKPANDYPEAFVIDAIARLATPVFGAGERFAYSNSGYFLLGEIVARVSGMRVGDYARQMLFAPLGMHATQFYDDYRRIVPNRAIGYEALPAGGWATELYLFDIVGDGGVLTTAGDLARWDANFYANRLPGGAALTAQMLTTRPLNDGSPNNYAAGLVIDSYRGLPTVHHAGGWAGYASFMLRFPGEHTTIIILSNRNDTPPDALGYRVADRVLAAVLTPTAAPSQHAGGAPAAVDLDQIIGRYRSEETGNVIRIEIVDNELTFLHPSGFTTALLALGDGRFAATALTGLTLTCVPADGITTSVTAQFADGHEVVLERLQPITLSAAERAALSGRYRCAELDIVYAVTADDDGLAAELPLGLGRHALNPSLADEFNSTLGTWRFARAADGQISGFTLQYGMLRDIRFSRLP